MGTIGLMIDKENLAVRHLNMLLDLINDGKLKAHLNPVERFPGGRVVRACQGLGGRRLTGFSREKLAAVID